MEAVAAVVHCLVMVLQEAVEESGFFTPTRRMESEEQSQTNKEKVEVVDLTELRIQEAHTVEGLEQIKWVRILMEETASCILNGPLTTHAS